jgi:hypothetical protein
MRRIGHVTPVPKRIVSVAEAMAPATAHTNGLWPWRSIHGWMWSLISRLEKPACSAVTACLIMSAGESSSAASP